MTRLGTGRVDNEAGGLLPWRLREQAGRALCSANGQKEARPLLWRFPHPVTSGFCHFCGCHFSWGGRRYTCDQTHRLEVYRRCIFTYALWDQYPNKIETLPQSPPCSPTAP